MCLDPDTALSAGSGEGGCRIRRLKSVGTLTNESPGYDTKPSDRKSLVLEL